MSYDVTQPFAKGIAELLAEREPQLIVAQMTKALRKRKVFIDWSQNSDFKTTVGVYSLRAKSHKPHVSLPVEWDELKAAVRKDDPNLLYFTPGTALSRVEKGEDIFEPLLTQIQKLPHDLVAHVGKPPRARNTSTTLAKTRQTGLRPSKQGSRRRFEVRRIGRRDHELRLEMGNTVRVWRLRGAIPSKAKQSRPAVALEDQPISTFENMAHRETHSGDYGTYELVDGSYKSGTLELFLNGHTLRGVLLLTRIDEDSWRIAKRGADTIDVPSKKAHTRTGQPRSAKKTRS